MQNITYELGNLADWISSIGTIGALFFAIILATKDSRSKLEITVINDKQRWALNGGNQNTYEFCVVNTRPKAVHLRSMSVYVKERFKKKKRISRMTDGQEPLLGSLKFGEMKFENATFNFQLLCKHQDISINKYTKFYVIFEDITGKKFKKRFEINI